MQTRKQYISKNKRRPGRPYEGGSSPFPLQLDEQVRLQLKEMSHTLDISMSRLVRWMVMDGINLGIKKWEDRCHQMYLDELEEKKQAIEEELKMGGRLSKANVVIDEMNNVGSLASNQDQMQFPFEKQMSIN